jgi:hypothetical protein
LSDRSLDIGPLWWRGVQLAWHAPDGFRSPSLTDLESEGGMGFGRSVSGFLVTCGLDHIRQPANSNPMHGRIPFTPARVLTHGESWREGEAVLFCEGEVTQARLGGEALRLRRRIEAPVGGSVLRIRDEVENIGATAWPHAMLYHFNLGYPAVADGTTVEVNGKTVVDAVSVPEEGGPAPAWSVPVAARKHASAVVKTPAGGDRNLSVALSFETETLPFLQFWRDLRPRCGIFSVEPCTSARGDEGQSTEGPLLQPAEKRAYSIEVRISGDAPAFDDLLHRE